MTLWEQITNDPLYRLVLVVGLTQVGLLGATAVSIVTVRLRRESEARRRKHRAARIRDPLFEYLAEARTLASLVEATRGERRKELAASIAPFAPTLDGTSLDRLAAFYEASGLAARGQALATSGLWWRRLEGMRILASAGGRIGVPELEMALRDPQPIVRLAAARGLGRTGHEGHLRPLLEAAQKGRTSRLQIAQVLIELGGPALPALRALIMELPDDDEHGVVRATALEVLALTGDVAAAPYIRYALEAQALEVRAAAFRSARLLNLNLTPDELRWGLKDAHADVRAVAAQTTGALREPALMPELKALLADPSWWVRTNAARALYGLGPEGAAALVAVLESSDDRFARDIARRTLTEDASYAAYLLPSSEAV